MTTWPKSFPLEDQTDTIGAWIRSHLTILALGAIVALGTVLRLYHAGAQGVWLDEAFSIWVGSRSLAEGWMWLIRVDQHPPLYYTLLHFWLALGDGEATVRLFSALLGIITIPVVYLVGRRLGGPGLGLAAAFILSISPFHVQFAQEVRMYTLLTLAGALSMYFLVSLLSDPEAARTPFGGQLAGFWRAWRQARRSPTESATPSAETNGPLPPNPLLPTLGEGGVGFPSPRVVQGRIGRPHPPYPPLLKRAVQLQERGEPTQERTAPLSPDDICSSSGEGGRGGEVHLSAPEPRVGGGARSEGQPPSPASPPELGGTEEGRPLFGYQRDWRQVRGLGTFARAGLPPLSTISTDLRWLGYMLATAAAVYTHNTAILLPIAQNLFVFLLLAPRISRLSPIADRLSPIADRVSRIATRNSQLATRNSQFATCNSQLTIRNSQLATRNWLLAQLGILFLWSPWLPVFFIHSARVYGEFWIPAPTWQTVRNTLLDFSSAFLPHQIARGTLMSPVFIFLFGLGLLRFRRQPRWLVLLLLLFTVPFAGELLASLRRPIFYTRTLIWASIPYYLLLAGGIMQLRYRPYQAAALIVLLVINGFSLRNFYLHYEKEGWDQAAAYVAQKVEPDDLLLFNATWVQIPFDYYFKRYNKPVAEHGVPADLFDLGVLEPKMTEQDLPRLQRLIRGRRRVWLIYSHDWYTDPQKLIPPALSAELSLLDQRGFRGLQVYRYGVR